MADVDKFLEDVEKGSGLRGTTDDVNQATERLSKKKMDIDRLF